MLIGKERGVHQCNTVDPNPLQTTHMHLVVILLLTTHAYIGKEHGACQCNTAE